MDNRIIALVFGSFFLFLLVAGFIHLERHTSNVYADLDEFLERAKRAGTRAELAALYLEVRAYCRENGVWHRSQIGRANEILAYISGKASSLP